MTTFTRSTLSREASSGRGPWAARSRYRRSLAATSTRWGSPARRSLTKQRRRSISPRWSVTRPERIIGFSRCRSRTARQYPAGPSTLPRRWPAGDSISIPDFRTNAARSPFSAAGSMCLTAGITAIAGTIMAGSSASSLRDPRDIVSWSTRGRGGGIWAPGGISSDGRALFVATGNTIGTSTWSDGEAVFRLMPDLRSEERSQDFFAPADWKALDERDADLGGSNPLPLAAPSSPGLVLALGKDARAYLLDGNNLGGIGGSLASKIVSTRSIRTAPAAYPAGGGVFVAFQGQGENCPTRVGGNLTVLHIRAGSPPSLDTAWCGAFKGEGSPIVTTTDGRANPIVWVVGAEGDGPLHGYRGDTGEPLFTGGGAGNAMTGLRHFQTLLAADDRLYVGGDGRIYAFGF